MVAETNGNIGSVSDIEDLVLDRGQAIAKGGVVMGRGV